MSKHEDGVIDLRDEDIMTTPPVKKIVGLDLVKMKVLWQLIIVVSVFYFILIYLAQDNWVLSLSVRGAQVASSEENKFKPHPFRLIFVDLTY